MNDVSDMQKGVETVWHSNIESRVWRTTLISVFLLACGIFAYRSDHYQWLGILLLFIAALVVGENLELKLIRRPSVPISFAAIMALARTTTNEGHFSWVHVSSVMAAAIVLATLCYSGITLTARLRVLVARIASYFVGLSLAHALFSYVDASSQFLYGVIIIAIIAMICVHELIAPVQELPRTYGFFAAAAHASVIAGGVLIGVGYAGTKDVIGLTSPEAGGNGLGVSALVTCTIPLLVAWFAFSRYYLALHTYKQTIRALSAAPELGGIVAWGHADRVAQIALAVADRLDVDRDDRQAIETAAYMHTLGDAVLDTTMDVDPYEEAQAASVTAEIVRSAGGLDRVADIIDDHVRPYRAIVNGQLVAQNDIAASVLRVANDYDNISRREETWGARAIISMLTAPAATYNPRALEALEWVLTRERYAELVNPPEMPARITELLHS